MDRQYEDPSELLKKTEIGHCKVKCWLSASQSTSVGIIGPFDEDISNEDLTEALKEAGFNGAVVERIFKSKEKIKTSMFKAIFVTNSLPRYVTVVLHSADLLLVALYAVAPTPAMSVTQPLREIAVTVVVTIQPIMEDAQK
ncbi:hypothetical protein FHG87_012441 [Trinorchestia longiramus]|nr:hypothetical protein FHG87_012441 [Trinorchestia longiramus]